MGLTWSGLYSYTLDWVFHSCRLPCSIWETLWCCGGSLTFMEIMEIFSIRHMNIFRICPSISISNLLLSSSFIWEDKKASYILDFYSISFKTNANIFVLNFELPYLLSFLTEGGAALSLNMRMLFDLMYTWNGVQSKTDYGLRTNWEQT